jgi:hypothetical protein
MSPGAERVLSPRELNRAVLARQLLLERGRDPLPRALEPFAKLARADREELEDEGRRLADLYASV